MILSKPDILKLIKEGLLKIDPISDDTIRENGLDLRLGRGVGRLKNLSDRVFEPNYSRVEDFYVIEDVESFILNPCEVVLIHTLEYIELPNDIVGLINLRSSYARIGLSLPPTIVDAGFKGELTLQIRGGSYPIKLTVGERMIHLILVKASSPTMEYSGKYIGQRGITLPRFSK
ncbi:dCTP deaminase [Candidatus Geothermarchaeota archaeon]|nr:MAG: dCTP deaminase [Candidatus Geothermarchaeota archaeon]HEW94331.1 dCTP deaminase [Thermoprotei archaeon]